MDEHKSLELDLLEELSPPLPFPGELDAAEPEVWPDPPHRAIGPLIRARM